MPMRMFEYRLFELGTYNHLQKILEKLRKLRKSCNIEPEAALPLLPIIRHL